ncbi:RHS repeat domain-containing protein, partial [Flavobacterium sp. LBUM151]
TNGVASIAHPKMIVNDIPNYLDEDDDGDGYQTWEEGVNPDGDGNPATGATLDTDQNGIHDYLDYQDRIYPDTEEIQLNNYVNLVGDKRYELSNHLGNVLAVISDIKIPELDAMSSLKYFNPDIISYSDYYPFGMLVPTRHGSSDSYRYGFNDMELDNEIKGEGNSYDFGARMLDSRVGRWFAKDPKESKYPAWSTYNYCFNNPLQYNDPDGKDPKPTIWHRAIESFSNIWRPLIKNKVEWKSTDIIEWKLKGNSYLFQRKAEFVKQYSDVIKSAAKTFDIPEFLLAGVAYSEYGGDPMWIDDVAYGVRKLDGSQLTMYQSIGKSSILTSF